MSVRYYLCAALFLTATIYPRDCFAAKLTLSREGNWLIIKGASGPGAEIRINYLEAYCRGNSTDADWVKHTMIRHKNQVLSSSGDLIRMRDTLEDGVTVEHRITAGEDEVDFRLAAFNPTTKDSEAQWAQPCVRVGDFTGFGSKETKDDYAYVPKCFIFLDGKLERLPTKVWATKARYIPGQVWCPKDVPRTDVNPRPLNPQVPGNGLIGCFSGDEKMICAMAWEPYQELFQGVARCVHSDFRIGGLKAGERKEIRGKIYIIPNNVDALLKRYKKDFPEHVAGQSSSKAIYWERRAAGRS